MLVLIAAIAAIFLVVALPMAGYTSTSATTKLIFTASGIFFKFKIKTHT